MLLASESQNPSRAEVRTWRSGNHGGVVAVPTALLLEIVPFLQISLPGAIQIVGRPSLHPITTRKMALFAFHASVLEAAGSLTGAEIPVVQASCLILLALKALVRPGRILGSCRRRNDNVPNSFFAAGEGCILPQSPHVRSSSIPRPKPYPARHPENPERKHPRRCCLISMTCRLGGFRI